MKIVSSFIPPVTNQPRFNSEAGKVDSKSEGAREVFAELVDDNLSVPVTAVVELGETQPQFASQQQLLSERVDLRLLRDEGLPLNNQRALESYQTVGSNGTAPDAGIAHLDIIV